MPRIYGRKRWVPGSVWVVLYEHEYGTDVNVHRTEEAAWFTVGEIIGSNIQDVESEKATAEIIMLLSKGDVGAALEIWKEEGPGEPITIERHEVAE